MVASTLHPARWLSKIPEHALCNLRMSHHAQQQCGLHKQPAWSDTELDIWRSCGRCTPCKNHDYCNYCIDSPPDQSYTCTQQVSHLPHAPHELWA